MKYILAIIIVSVVSAQSRVQVDFAPPVSFNQLQCMKDAGIQFISMQAYSAENDGMFNYNICESYRMAKELGLTVAIHMKPSLTMVKSAADQVDEMIFQLSSCGIENNRFSIMAEQPEEWNVDPIINVDVLRDIIYTSRERRMHVETIHTNKYAWETITNETSITDIVPRYPPSLWLAEETQNGLAVETRHHNGMFGGWETRDIQLHQFAKYMHVCGVTVNESYNYGSRLFP